MKKNKDIIWIFGHLPKSGGITFNGHLLKTLESAKFFIRILIKVEDILKYNFPLKKAKTLNLFI